MTETEKLVAEFHARGGTINYIPAHIVRRSDHLAAELKKREILESLRERAKALQEE